jgi:hypothetical protein
MKMALEAIRVLRQERIHKTKQLHDALVLAKIFVTCRTLRVMGVKWGEYFTNRTHPSRGIDIPFRRCL